MGVTSECTGDAVQVIQFRQGERVWAGKVTVRAVGACCYGKRACEADYGQWQVGDTIVCGCNRSQLHWHAKDVVNLGTEMHMFDFTVPRLDSGSYSSVELALQALNSGALTCEEGICIVESSLQKQYFLLVREGRSC